MLSEPGPLSVQISRRGLLRAAGLTGLSLAALAACGNGSPAQSVASGTPREGGRLVVGVIGAGQAESILPSVSNQRQDLPRIFSLYDNLFRRGADGKAAPLVLESAEPSADFRTWTLRLRPGVAWHNGGTASADDLLHTIGTWSTPTHPGHGATKPLIDFKNVRKRDGLTVEVPLLLAVRDFPSVLAGQSFALVKAGVPADTDHPIGTGPFKFGSFTPGERSVFPANRDYWGTGPYVDELVVDTSFTDEEARLSALMGGKIHAIDNLDYGLARVNSSNDRIVVLDSPAPTWTGFYMKTTDGVLRDQRVRQALRLLADRDALVKSALNGYGSVGNDLPANGTQFYAADLVRERDIDQAKSLLRAAGQSDLRIELGVIGSSPGATLLQQQAKAAGVTIDVVTQDAAQFYGPQAKPFAFTSWDSANTSLTQAYLTMLWSGASWPETAFGNPADDALLFDAIGEPDEAKAAEKWHVVQQIQFDRGGYLIWGNANYVDAVAPNVHGIVASRASALGGYHFNEAWLD